MSEKQKHHHSRKRFFTWVGVILVLTIVCGGAVLFVWSYRELYKDKIFPGVYVGSINVGGLTIGEASQKIQSAWDEFQQKGVRLLYGDKHIILTGIVRSSAGPDLTYELAHADIEQAQQAAYSVGRQGGALASYLEPLWVRLVKLEVPLKSQLNIDRILKYINDSIPEIATPSRPADIHVNPEGVVSIAPERIGYTIKIKSLEYDLVNRFNEFSNEPVVLQLTASPPFLTESEVAPLVERAKFWVQVNKPLVFEWEKDNWSVPASNWYSWITVDRQNNEVNLVLSPHKAESFLNELRKKIDQPALNAAFEVLDSKVVKFQPSQLGRQIDATAILSAAQAVLDSGQAQSVTLVVKATEPTISTAQANEYGISEIIGVGRSNFSGSPKNRRVNIKVGAQKLQGVIIKPEEEFSLIKILGAIDAEHGFLPELVIKDNKTVPEFGGGLCQIGTTTFRAALNSGLPILERQNHSYRVPYYEPAGTDATIYDPKPDFRFKNNTGSAILMQTNIQGDDLVFEFWGKRDGRVATTTKPRIFNIVDPPPTKIIETEDLPAGEKKCTEKPHVGADAEFTYSVTYADGQKLDRVFKSHYVPWQEVCLLGVVKTVVNEIKN